MDRRPIPYKTVAIFAGVLFLVLQGVGWTIAGKIGTGEGIEAPSLKSSTADDRSLRKKLNGLAPKGNYLVVDTSANRVYLRNGDRTVREMIASCGSGNILEDPAGGRKWTFDTPRGVYKVESKLEKPLWKKPDWAFLEEGKPIPRDDRDRMEGGMMGDYALGFGKGYFIHGTLYTRLLGRNVSHGCVRLGDDDLKTIYQKVPIGSTIIIF